MNNCSFCSKTFSKKYHCFLHKKLHEFTCQFCEAEFYSQIDLNNHENDHIDFKKVCTICNIEIFDREFYAYHRHMHTIKKTLRSNEKLQCDFCRRSFTYKKSFIAHSSKCDKKHTNLMCDLCNHKPFKRKFDLEQHVRKHTSELTFTCDLCNKGFLRKKSLLVHLSTHHDEAVKDHPFQCKDCEKVFSKQFNLQRHQRKFHKQDKQERKLVTLYSLGQSLPKEYKLIGLQIEFVK